MRLLARFRKGLDERLARKWRPSTVRSRATRPLVSFTFDDFPSSAVENGARILKESGSAGTFYVAGCFEGKRIDGILYYSSDDLIALSQDQHEIGCHTFSHLRLPLESNDRVREDIARNQDFVRAILGDYHLASFAYPFGYLDVRKKIEIGRHFPIARGIWPGVNRLDVDFQQLLAVPMESRSFSYELAVNALNEAQASNGWLIFFTHDVSDTPSPYGCTPKTLARVLDEVLRRGIEVLPVKSAAARVRFGEISS